jgi:hypothetical protein
MITTINATKVRNILNLIANCEVYIVNEDVCAEIVNESHVINDADNEVLYLGWENYGNDYRIKFTEEGLNNAIVENGNLIIADNEGDIIKLMLYKRIKQNITTEDLLKA